MERFLNPLSLPPRGDGELARALGMDQRRAAPYALEPHHKQQRRSSVEPIVPALTLASNARSVVPRRRSMPVLPSPEFSAFSANGAPMRDGTSLSVVAAGRRWSREGAIVSGGINSTHSAISANFTNAGAGGGGSGSARVAQQWALLDVVAVPGLREDYYSTLIASACSPYPWEGDDWAFVHDTQFDSCEEDLLSLNRLGEVLLAASWYACRLTPQLGPQLFKHTVTAQVTCVALTRLGYCVMGDSEGNLLMFDMVQDPPPLLIQQRLSDIIALDDGADPQRHHATHLLWSDKTPCTLDTVLARCGYRIEFFVGTNTGAVCKIVADAALTFTTEFVTPVALRHGEGICAMSFDYNQDMLVVAGVDSEVSVWTHATAAQGAAALEQRYRFRQYSAIKGMAFCPGLDRLIALGGGRRDRALRIYDVEERKVVRKVAMPAQVVGVVWVSRWEVFVALGHSRLRHYSGIGKVYNLAVGRIVCDIPGAGYALSAVKTTRGVAVYTSEHTLLEFCWRPEAVPRTSADVLAALKMTYPPSALR